MPVHHIPEGYNSITPYLIVKGAAEAIDYYKNILEPQRSCAWLNRTAGSATLNSRSEIPTSCSPTSSRRWIIADHCRSAVRL